MVIGPDSIGDLSRLVELVAFLETQGEGLQRPESRSLQLLLRERSDDGAVDAAAEEGADRHVADQMAGDGLPHGGADLVRQGLLVLGCSVVELEPPVAVNLDVAGGEVDRGEGSRWETEDAAEERLDQRVVLQREVVHQGVSVHHSRALGIDEQRLDLRRECRQRPVG